MHDIRLIEEYYNKFITNLNQWIPEGLYNVDLELLNRFDLLHFQHIETVDTLLTDSFQIVETNEKLTLINNEFVIWIVPSELESNPSTYAMIAINKSDHLKLEVAFIASGVYNTSKLVLRLLEKFLEEIHADELMLSKFKKS